MIQSFQSIDFLFQCLYGRYLVLQCGTQSIFIERMPKTIFHVLLMNVVIPILYQVTVNYSIGVIELGAWQADQLFLYNPELLFGQDVSFLFFQVISSFYDIVKVGPMSDF